MTVGHPLAYLERVAVDRDAIRVEFGDWTGLPIPEELLEVWCWWGGLWAADAAAAWAVDFPGPLNLLPFSQVRRQADTIPEELLSERTKRWVPVMRCEVAYEVWAELDEVRADGSLPLTYSYFGGLVEDGVIARFSSFSELLAAMAFLIRTGLWPRSESEWSPADGAPPAAAEWVALMNENS